MSATKQQTQTESVMLIINSYKSKTFYFTSDCFTSDYGSL